MQNKVSGGAILKALGVAVKNAPGGNIVSRTTQRFINTTKVSHPAYGSQKLKDLLKKPVINKKIVDEIFEQAAKKGIFRKTPWTKTSSGFFKRAVQEDQRIIQTEKKQEAVQKTVKPQDEKDFNIAAARLKTKRMEYGREMRLGGKIGQVIEEQNKFRKTWGKSAELTVTSRGGMAIEGRGGTSIEQKSTGLLNKAIKEDDEKNSPKGSKSGQKDGGSVPAGQKSVGHQPVKLQGSAGIDQLTHRQEVAKGENLPGGVYHVDGLNNKESVSQPETPPAPRSASAPEDITDLDIG